MSHRWLGSLLSPCCPGSSGSLPPVAPYSILPNLQMLRSLSQLTEADLAALSPLAGIPHQPFHSPLAPQATHPSPLSRLRTQAPQIPRLPKQHSVVRGLEENYKWQFNVTWSLNYKIILSFLVELNKRHNVPTPPTPRCYGAMCKKKVL